MPKIHPLVPRKILKSLDSSPEYNLLDCLSNCILVQILQYLEDWARTGICIVCTRWYFILEKEDLYIPSTLSNRELLHNDMGNHTDKGNLLLLQTIDRMYGNMIERCVFYECVYIAPVYRQNITLNPNTGKYIENAIIRNWRFDIIFSILLIAVEKDDKNILNWLLSKGVANLGYRIIVRAHYIRHKRLFYWIVDEWCDIQDIGFTMDLIDEFELICPVHRNHLMTESHQDLIAVIQNNVFRCRDVPKIKDFWRINPKGFFGMGSRWRGNTKYSPNEALLISIAKEVNLFKSVVRCFMLEIFHAEYIFLKSNNIL